MLTRIATTLAAFCLAGSAMAQDLPVIRAAVLKIGTVNWELSTISENGLDEKHGFRLEVMPYADNGATRIAVEGGEADMAVADWIWIARQRADGKDYVAVPYSRAVGGVVVPGESPGKIAEHDGWQPAAAKGVPVGHAGFARSTRWLFAQH